MEDYIEIKFIGDLINEVKKLLDLDYNVIFISDIDDTILSTKIGKKFVEKEITYLIDLIYSLSPSNLIFLTAREPTLYKYTLNKLNSSGLLHKGKYIYYNLICSPCDLEGNVTKGETIFHYINNKKDILISLIKKNYIIFIDDLIENIVSVKKYLELLGYDYTCCLYNHQT